MNTLFLSESKPKNPCKYNMWTEANIILFYQIFKQTNNDVNNAYDVYIVDN